MHGCALASGLCLCPARGAEHRADSRGERGCLAVASRGLACKSPLSSFISPSLSAPWTCIHRLPCWSPAQGRGRSAAAPRTSPCHAAAFTVRWTNSGACQRHLAHSWARAPSVLAGRRKTQRRSRGCRYRCTFGSGLMGRPEAQKKSTAQNNLVLGRHGPLYRAGFGPRSRPMGGHGHGPFKADTKWPI
jgi:hypothetical protein